MTQPAAEIRHVVDRSGFANPLTLGVLVEDIDYLKVYADLELLQVGVDYTVLGIGDSNGVTIEIIGADDINEYVGYESFTALYDPVLQQGADLSLGGNFGRAFESALDIQNRQLQAVAERAYAVSANTNAAAESALLAEAAADAAELAANAAEDAAAIAATGAGTPIFATLALAQAYSPTLAPDFIKTAGYSAAGDLGGALYKKVGAQPAHLGRLSLALSGGGTAWYELAETTVTPQMFGAATTASATVNTTSFRAMTAFINAKGGGHVLVAGGEFTVFYETINPAPSTTARYYQFVGDIMPFSACNGLVVEFVGGASLKAASGLHYGSFNPLTGIAYENGSTFTNTYYAAEPYSYITFLNCQNVVAKNVKINGNSSNFVLGGRWGDTGIQLGNSGINVNNCVGVEIFNADIQYCGLDGVYVTHSSNNTRINVKLDNIVSMYNGRQGLSWTGGWGLDVSNCVFAHTGRGAVTSSPGAGIDIEGSGGALGQGHFSDCQMFDNWGPSTVNDTGSANGAVVFDRCIFQNPTAGHAFWYANPGGAILNDCSVYGDIVSVGVCIFNRCYFTNGPWHNGVTSRVLLADVNSAAKFLDCTFNMFEQTSYNIYLRGGAIARRCRFIFSAAVATARLNIAILSCVMEDCTYEQNYGNDAAASPAGEHTFIDLAGGQALLKGKNVVSGAALAIGGRAGSVNFTILQGSKTFDPPSIAAGASSTTTVTVEAALVGDYAVASFSLALGGLLMTTAVSAGTVTVTFYNPTASAIDLASGTLAARIIRP